MHEYPYALRIIEVAAEHAQKAGAARVTRIRLTVGESSGLMAESIALYFELISEGTLCEGASLEITTVKPMLRCRVCGRLFERRPFSFACGAPGCGGEGAPTEIGREFVIESITVETESQKP